MRLAFVFLLDLSFTAYVPSPPWRGRCQHLLTEGGRGLSAGPAPSVDPGTAGPPLCPVPGHLPRKGGEGRKGRGCAGFGSGVTGIVLILPRTEDLSSPPCHPGRAQRDPGPTHLQSRAIMGTAFASASGQASGSRISAALRPG